LARVLEVRGDVRHLAELHDLGRSSERRFVVVVENSERLLTPTPQGVAAADAFLRLVGRTGDCVLWILLMARPAAMLALHRLELANRVPTVVGLDPMTPDGIQNMIMRRHRLSGFELEFQKRAPRAFDRIRRPVASIRAVTDPAGTFFARLSVLTRGNPRQALYYWLGSARMRARAETRIVVQSLPDDRVDLLRPLSLTQRLTLALLSQHGSLDVSQLSRALATTTISVESDLKVLWVSRYVAPSNEFRDHWTLRPIVAHALLGELRSANMV
jgi:hypothetical protein